MTANQQYDFITNAGGPPVKKGIGANKTKLLMFAAGGGIVLVIIFMIISSMFGGAPDNKQQLIKVAQQQNEIIRVTELALKETKTVQARNLAMTVKLSLETDQQPLLSALSKQKVKVSANALKGGKDPNTDKLLIEAKQNNRYDEAFLEYIQSELVEYQKNLADVYKNTVSKSLKETLKENYTDASLIIGVEPET